MSLSLSLSFRSQALLGHGSGSGYLIMDAGR
jgi:hypothetical protein